jgi:hypothetical protein
MNDLTKILLTSSLTAVGAIAVFVASQLLGKLVIEPIQDLKKLLGEIRYALVFHAQAVFTPVGDRAGEDRACEEFRKLACDLRSKLVSVILPLLSGLHRLPIMRISCLAAGPLSSVARTSSG